MESKVLKSSKMTRDKKRQGECRIKNAEIRGIGRRKNEHRMDVYRIQNISSKKYFDDEGNEYTPIHSLRICSGKEKEVREIDGKKDQFNTTKTHVHTHSS